MSKIKLPERLYYVLRGTRVHKLHNLMQWAAEYEAANRHIKHTKLKKHYVSTIFMGLDHSFGGKKPILFETMVFKNREIIKKFPGEQVWKTHPSVDKFSQRYSTYTQAVRGHNATVKAVKKLEK